MSLTSATSTPGVRRRGFRGLRIALVALVVVSVSAPVLPATPARARVVATTAAPAGPTNPSNGTSLEAAANRAGDTGRKVAMSLIGLAFAVAAIVLSFRRDFKEAAGVLAVGVVAVLLATPAGIRLLQDTVSSIFGSQ